MASKHSTKLSLEYRGARINFGLHQPTGQYRKKYKGRTLYLGADPNKVLEQWLAKTELIETEFSATTTGLTPPSQLTVAQLCNQFLAAREADIASGELAQITFDQYFLYAKRITAFFGRERIVADLGPDDFASLKIDLAKPQPTRRDGKIVRKASPRKLSLIGLASKIRHIRVIFNHAYDEGWIDKLPWGAKSFTTKTKAAKKNAARRQPKQATREEIKTLLDAADDMWKALILLGVNSGSGNTDAAVLRHNDISRDGWVENARHKTGEYRRFKLWPETLKAIAKLPKHTDGYIFHSTEGATLIPKGKHNLISKGFLELTKKTGVRRENLTFYSMRHTFQTQADEALDFIATKIIMGHSRNTISDNYRGKISDERLEAVTTHVRNWLFEVAN
jgi:hypothetical protein